MSPRPRHGKQGMEGAPLSFAASRQQQQASSPTGLLSNSVVMAGILDYVLINLPQQVQAPTVPQHALVTKSYTVGSPLVLNAFDSVTVTWSHFYTTDLSRFATELGGAGVHNTAGDDELWVLKEGYVVYEFNADIIDQTFSTPLGIEGSFALGGATSPDAFTLTTASSAIHRVSLQILAVPTGQSVSISNTTANNYQLHGTYSMSAIWFPGSPENIVF